jgi:sporulation related protein
MSSYAYNRPPAVDIEGAKSQAGPRENPLEEFARLMGADVRALERFGRTEHYVASSGSSLDTLASEIRGSLALDEDETSVHGAGSPYGAIQPADLYASAEAPVEEPTPRRSGALTVGVLVAVGFAGCLGVWALIGAPGLPGASWTKVGADEPLKAPPATRESAVGSDSNANAPENLTAKPGRVNLASTENQPSAIEEQTRSPSTTPSAATTPIPMEALPSAMAAAAPVSSSAATPVTRSIAPLASSSGQTQGPEATEAPRATPTTSPEPKPVKTISVRPDGSVVPNDGGTSAGGGHSQTPAAARTSPAAAPLLDPPTPVARPSFEASAGAAPKPAREKLATAANTLDHEPVARIDAAAPNASPPAKVAAAPSSGADSVFQFVPNLYEQATHALGGSPQATPAAAADPSPPTAPAAAAPGGGFSAEAVLQFVPNLYEKAASALRGSPPATQVARVDPKPPTAGDARVYSVQFGSPTTEPAARKTSARLRSKFARELGGLQPTVRQAQVDGRKLYQVSIGGMSKADAAALCLKLNSSGGGAACSVAGN